MNEHGHETHTTKQDGHLVIYLVWPALAGVVLAIVLAISVGGLAAMVTRSITSGARWFGFSFFVVLGAATLTVFVYAAYQWAGPRYVEWTRQTVDVVDGDVIDAPDPVIDRRFIAVNTSNRKRLIAPPQPQTGIDDRSVLARVRAAIAPETPHTIEMQSAARAIEPDAEPWVKEFYDVTCKAYGMHSLSRNAFKTAFGADGYRALHDRYVAGTRDGKTPGLWESWGILTDGPRNSRVFAYNLADILKMDPDVWSYAQAKNATLPHSPSVDLSTKKVDGCGPDGTGLVGLDKRGEKCGL